ncbi:MAG TPA: hypothetical protein VN450_06790, partial [Candidatus Methylomirabilis sp.]|nr:hypothetical protein [Candidatus Methylomirabilis sp.]
MLLSALYAGSAVLLVVAAWRSFVFLSTGRLGRVWSLVPLALLLKGLLSAWGVFAVAGFAFAPFTES